MLPTGADEAASPTIASAIDENLLPDSVKIPNNCIKVGEGSLNGRGIKAEKWPEIYTFIKNDNYSPNLYRSSPVEITTKDANTLTHGPTLYITDNVEKVALFCHE